MVSFKESMIKFFESMTGSIARQTERRLLPVLIKIESFQKGTLPSMRKYGGANKASCDEILDSDNPEPKGVIKGLLLRMKKTIITVDELEHKWAKLSRSINDMDGVVLQPLIERPAGNTRNNTVWGALKDLVKSIVSSFKVGYWNVLSNMQSAKSQATLLRLQSEQKLFKKFNPLGKQIISVAQHPSTQSQEDSISVRLNETASLLGNDEHRRMVRQGHNVSRTLNNNRDVDSEPVERTNK